MKKTLLFLGTIAVSAVTSGVTVWAVDRSHTDKIEYIEREVERTPALGSHFTAYEADKYPDLTYAAENAVKAVVNIEAIQQVDVSSGYGGGAYDPFFEFFGIPQGYGRRGGQPQTQERRAGGSGVIISDDGYIVTNNHVIEDATKLRVKLNDGRTFEAKLIGKDSATDLALLKIEAADLPTVPFGSSDALRLGEWVLAIGSPFDLQSTITAGIVSAKARNLGVIPNDFSIEAFIQTDAAVNPGNSGGPIINEKNEVVGITVSKFTGSDADNMGFGIRVETLHNLFDSLGELDRDCFQVQCESCDELISDEEEFCPSCGEKLPEGVFEERQLSPLSEFCEAAIEKMGINPVLARDGNEAWLFHKGSSEIRMFVYDRTYLFAVSPISDLSLSRTVMNTPPDFLSV